MSHLALGIILLGLGSLESEGDGSLHERIDALILSQAGMGKPAELTTDEEFLRRVSLDLIGRIPSTREAQAFLKDPAPDKRARWIDQRLASEEYPRRMQELFDVVLMERLGEHPAWARYLRAAFAANKPWDRIAREVLRADPADEANRGAAFFLAKRLERYGENPVDYPGLAADVGRFFLGVDLRCAQCHDHLFVEDYKQRDFQGLLAFVRNASLRDIKGPTIEEKPTTGKLAFTSVFTRKKGETGPRVPGGEEVTVPEIKPGEEYVTAADPRTGRPGTLRFSPLAELSARLPVPENRAFARNIANRLWLSMMGRGLVHPPDQFHSENPASHPELLELLADELTAHRFDVKWLLRELALTRTYQRSSRLPAGPEPAPESFLVGQERRLSAEQMLRSVLQATGERTFDLDEGGPAAKEPDPDFETWRVRFVKAFANPPREPEDERVPTLKAALFVLNDQIVLSWLKPRSGNLVGRLAAMKDDGAIAEELYLSVLTRLPDSEERAEVADTLTCPPEKRVTVLGHLVWALLASTEFSTNH